MSMWVSMGVYGNLWINMKIRLLVDIYASLCMFVHGAREAIGFMRVYGGFSESMDKYEYAGIYGYSWKIMVAYGQI